QWYRDGEKEPGGDQRTLVVSDSGEYRVMVKSASGCYSLSEPITVSISDVEADAGPDTVICRGTHASLHARVFGGTPPFRFRWSPAAGLSDAGTQHPLATPDSTTVYTVTVTDSLNCETRDSVTVEVRTLTVDAGSDAFVCKGESTPLNAVVKGGTAPFSYRWFPAEGLDRPDVPAPTARPGGTTTYTLRVIDALGCVAEDSVKVSVSTLTVSVKGNETVCEGGTVGLSASASGGAGGYRFRWAPDAGLSSTTIPDPVARPPTTTAYQVEVRDAVGCTTRATVVVFVLPRPQVRITASGPLALCRGDSVLLRATPGYPFYAWSTGAQTPSIFAREAGIYAVLVRDSLGCEGRDSVEVTVFDYPSPVIVPLRPLVFCPGDSTILDAGEGYFSYEWSTGQSMRYLVVRADGEYRVRVANAAGCWGVSPPVTVRTLPAPEPAIHGPDTVCVAATTSYNTIPLAGCSYRWSAEGGIILSGSDSSSVRVSWYEQGKKTLSLTVTNDSTGCAGTVHFPVNVSAGPKPRIEPAGVIHLCSGDSIVLDGGRGYVSWRWRGPGGMDDTLQRITVRAPGLYLLSVVDDLGCTGYDSVRVFVHDPPRPIIVAEPRIHLCDGDTVRLRTDGEYRSYRWSTGDTTAEITVSREGLYSVTVLDEFGCVGNAPPLFIRVFPKPEPLFTGPETVCGGESALYTAPSVAGVKRWWAVENGKVLQSSPDTILIEWNGEKAGSIRLTEIVDSSGCSATVSREIRILPAPEPILFHGGHRVFCAGDSAVIRTEKRYASYLWHDGGTADTCVVKSSTRVEVTVVDSNGCRGKSRALEIEVVDPPSPVVDGPRSACIGATAVYRVQASRGLSFRWDVENGVLIGPSNLDSVVVRWGGPGVGKVRIHVRIDSLACERSAECEVTVSSSLHPRVMLIGSSAFCEGDSVILDAGGGYEEYTWFDSSETVIGSDRRLKRTTGGVFSVRVKDASGCEGTSDTIAVTVFPLPQPIVSGPSTLCEGDTVVLDAGGGYTVYEWLDGSGRRRSGERFFAVTDSGTYLVCVVDADGCRNCSRPHVVSVFPRPQKPVIRVSQDTLYTDAGAVSYAWYRNDTLCPGAESRFLVHPLEGRYRVRIVDVNGCTSESEPYDYFEAVTASAVVALPVIEASPGDVVEIPVILERAHGLVSALPCEFTAVLRFHRGLLVPLGETPLGTVQGEDRFVPVRASLDTSAGIPLVLSRPVFRAALGPIESTPLHLADVVFTGGKKVDVTLLDGEFRVNVCREGGVRLFDGSARLFLGRNTPNPFNAQTVIEYEVPGPGAVRLSVYDILGREVAVLADSYHEKGRYRTVFDAGGLSTGIYAYVLRSPDTVLVEWMTVAK
ncbi:MAG: T9SS type A sorting domain-containing protein, partial [Bacteroidota bacterium]|nr:T9SS type A sorting domain-containing protein [Bacteroidota bacterium]